MTVRLYQSSDVSAPTLSGTAGDLTNVLRKCLVDGYGSQPAAGWSLPSLGGTNPGTGANANVIVFQQGTGSNGFYLRVNDSGTRVGTLEETAGVPTALEARIRGYETMTAITDSGITLFPTTTQQVYGCVVMKSATVSTIIRPWVILADQRTFYMFILNGVTASSYYGWMFGEFYSYKTNDNYRTMISARFQEGVGGGYIDSLDIINLITATQFGKYIARDVMGAPGAIAAGTCGKLEAGNGTVPHATMGVLLMPNPSDRLVQIAPLRVTHIVGGNTIRGRMRGLWHYCHPIATCSDRDTFSGQQGYAGKSFMILKQSQSSGVYCLEISDTWDTN